MENAYDIIVTGEINGEDTLTFSIPFRDSKRKYLENEKKIQIVDDVYKIRTVTDVKDSTGNTVTQIYAEAEFMTLLFLFVRKKRSLMRKWRMLLWRMPLQIPSGVWERSMLPQSVPGRSTEKTLFPSSAACQPPRR